MLPFRPPALPDAVIPAGRSRRSDVAICHGVLTRFPSSRLRGQENGGAGWRRSASRS